MKYIPVTPEILKAIDDAAKDAGSNVKLAQQAGIAPSTIGCYLLGKRENIKESIFNKLYPFIQPYLEESHTANFDFSKTAIDIAAFYDTLDEDGKNKMKIAQRDILMKMYNEMKNNRNQ
jgi:hypothetical protein